MKIAVVTGGGHGIGRALCRRLHRDGMHVVVADIEGDAARTVAEEIDGLAREIDVTDEAAMVAMIDDIESNVGPIELFISNAGVAFGDGKSGSISREGGLVPVDERCLSRAAQIGTVFGLRVVDAIHLAAATRLPSPVRYLTLDPRQVLAAVALDLEPVPTPDDR